MQVLACLIFLLQSLSLRIIAHSDFPCSHPGQILHGIPDWNEKSSIVKFACFQGYHLVGPPQLECRYETWYPDERPTCHPVVCSYPTIRNGRLDKGEEVKYHYRDEASVICNDGFEIRNAQNKVTCREDGSWEGINGDPFPICKEKNCHYPDISIPLIENGSLEIKGSRNGVNGDYKPGSVIVFKCNDGYVLIPLSGQKRVCGRGKWVGNVPTCVLQNQTPTRKSHCPAPPSITNGYYFTDRRSETPLALPVSEGGEQYEYGTVARYRCKDGLSLRRLHGEDQYRCLSNGEWSPKFPPICVDPTLADSLNDPLEQDMCQSPPVIPHADFDRIEGYLTSNGGLHGTILEYTCEVGYRDSRTPCLPTRRTCHAGKWIGRKPTCIPFDYCDGPPTISHGFMKSQAQNAYKVFAEVLYDCNPGYRMKSQNSLKCSSTGCWTPNTLPQCVRKDLFESTWSGSQDTPLSIIAILVSITVGCAIIALLTTVCLVIVCKRKSRPSSPTQGPAHWSTTVTVTPECRPREPLNRRQDQDRMALIAFADGLQQVTLPSYEEALRDTVQSGSHTSECDGLQSSRPTNRYLGRRNPSSSRRSTTRTILNRFENRENSDGFRHGSNPRGRRCRNEVTDGITDSIAHSSMQFWSSASNQQHQYSTLRSQSGGSSETVEVQSSGMSDTPTALGGDTSSNASSQNHSCRALAGSLAAFETTSMNSEGLPLQHGKIKENSLNEEDNDESGGFNDSSVKI